MAMYQIYGNSAVPIKADGIIEAYLVTVDGFKTLWPNFTLPTFTGAHALFGDEKQGHIEIYESGTLTLSPASYDLFCVGGGRGYFNYVYNYCAGGGGYTQTLRAKRLSGDILVTVGAGGLYVSNSVNQSQVRGGDSGIGTALTAKGAEPSGKGGSGGGAHGKSSADYAYNGGDGGSDGGAGDAAYNGTYHNEGSSGQGRTTRAFEEANQTLYAGGGGGYSGGAGTPGAGGSGGGGRGNGNTAGQSGTPNTGGGCGGGVNNGTGGSGIAIIRWGYEQ